MAYWKYHIQSGDLLQFWYEAEDDDTTRLYWGTLRGIILPDDYDEDEVKSYDDIELSDFDVKIKSGKETVVVNLEHVVDRVKEEDRKTEIPLLSEEFRLVDVVMNP